MRHFIILLLLCGCCGAASYYASPSGSGLVGSLASPIGLSNALKSAVSPAQAGDTVWLRGGTYSGRFVSTLTAPTNNPIIVRQYPNERAILDVASVGSSSGLEIEGSGTWFWGFEVMNSYADRQPARPNGIEVNTSSPGDGNKLINLIIHETGDGVFASTIATNLEIVGCIIYNGGYQNFTNGDRGHGHGIYLQNGDGGTKVVRDNIIFGQMGFCMQIFSGSAPVRGFSIFGNASFDAGALITNGILGNILIETGGNYPLKNIVLHDNYVWQTFAPTASLQLGYDYPAGYYNDNCVVTNNWFCSSSPLISFFTNSTVSANSVASIDAGNGVVSFNAISGVSSAQNAFSGNTYYRINPGYDTNDYVYFDNTNMLYSAWQSLGHDLDSVIVHARPSSTNVFIRANPYESGRANISVLNWNTNDVVGVDVSAVLSVGWTYQIKNGNDYLGQSVASGSYSGGVILLPMTNLSVALPVGTTTRTPTPTGPNFNQFVLIGQPGATMNVTTLSVGTIR